MILDSLANIELYNSMNKHFAKTCEYLRSVDLTTLAEGKYPIDGDNVFMLVNERDLKKPADAALEIHNEYIDIQIVVKGTEGFGWKDRALCTAPRGEYSAEKDILFYEDKPSTYFTLNGGEIAIFFPGDAHAPLVGEGHVRKAIVKVRVK